MSTQREKIIRKALEILESRSNGIRYSELLHEIKNQLPEVPENTISGTIGELDKKKELKIEKPERGIFILKKYIEEYGYEKLEESEKTGRGINEVDFYEPFANYLREVLDECTKAIPLGGNKFRDKWGTPDVLGVYKFSETNFIRPPIEIISAEIKTDTNQLVTAFGQACSYKLFSHKVYLVVPNDAEMDIGRVESLCLRFGIGLILFDKNNPQNPNFQIRNRATKSEPDYFYVNEYLKRLGGDAEELF
jgi:hypothetical protein